jgi:PhoH-like ATPase
MKKTYLLDTNVYMTDAEALFKFEDNNIIIPTIILDEIDRHKGRQDSAGANARYFNRILDSLRKDGSLYEGISLGENKGMIKVVACDNAHHLPAGFDKNHSDNKMLAAALSLGKEVIIVSRDINFRVKCDAVGLSCEGYENERVVDNAEDLYSGIADLLVPSEEIDKLYQGLDLVLSATKEKDLHLNQYLVLGAEENPKQTILVRYMGEGRPLRRLHNLKDEIWGLRARNKEQEFALDALMDPDIKLVTLVGRAGSGKTLISIAAGMEQVIQARSHKTTFTKLMVSKPVESVGKDIGFLPGSLEEKLGPWLAPIKDNLEALMGDKAAMETYMEQGIIEIEAITFIRGRSIANAYMIIDEAQNLNVHEIKTILTRVAEGTKIVLTGDIQQIDNSYVDAESNGLTYVVEKFKPFGISGHVTLSKGERSELATIAAEIL